MFDILTLCTVKIELYMIYIERETIISWGEKKREEKRRKKEVEFRGKIFGNLWGQEVLLLLEQGTSSFDHK